MVAAFLYQNAKIHHPFTLLGIAYDLTSGTTFCCLDRSTLLSDSGKLAVLDSLLNRMKVEGHRVLIYSQMTKMIDILEVCVL